MDSKQPLSKREQLLRKSCKTWHHVKVGLIATLLNFFNGTTDGFLLSTNRKILLNQLPFPSVESDITRLTTMITCFTLLGPLLFTFALNRFGRKPTLLMLLIPIACQYIIVYVASDVRQLMLAISIGYMSSLMTLSVEGVYLTEVEAPHLRGSFNSLLYGMMFVGSLSGLVLNWTCTFRETSLVLLVVCGVYLCFAWHLPESPYYLIKKNRIDEAHAVLKNLYGPEVGNLEVLRLEQHIKLAKTGRLVDLLRSAKNRRILFRLFILYFLKYFSGFICMVWFAPILLRKGHYHLLSAFTCEIIMFVVALVFGWFLFPLYRYISRRRLGLLSVSLMIPPYVFLMVFFHFQDTTPIFAGVTDFIPFVPLLLIKIFAILGVAPLPFIYFREFTPVEYVAYFSLIMDISAPLFNAICMFVFNVLRVQYGLSVCFAFFLACLLVGGGLFYVFIPETHGKIVENIQETL